MELLETIVVDHQAHDKLIEARFGDLTDPDWTDRSDVLVVSAFPGDYSPVPGSLIGALAGRGLSVTDMAAKKEYDLRGEFSCWLSRPIAPELGLGYGRLLCFEPPYGATRPAERIDDIFRALAPFIGLRDRPVTSVAMPLVACGSMRTPVRDIAEPLIRAAMHWMRTSPLHRVRIVENDELRAAELKSEAERVKRLVVAEQTSHEKDWDVFLSYSHADAALADLFVSTLRELAPGIRIFRDTDRLRTGIDYRVALDQAVRRSLRFVPLLTPSYVLSKACQDEFNAAWSIRERHELALFFPLALKQASLNDPRMAHVQYEDCIEADPEKLMRSCQKLVRALGLVTPEPIARA